jgi:alpha-galactosidase
MVSSLLFVALGLQKLAPIKVFILSGQSNMVGHGFWAADPKRNGGKGSLEEAVRAGKFKDLFDKDGKWRVRDDVWIQYFDRKGQLTVGYGAGEDCIGPELGFGNVVGDAREEPVLLVKLAWGGKSLYADFRPPSSGGTLGPYYTEVIKGTVDAIAKIGTNFPQFKGRAVEIAGFGWHQGWNDRINADAVAEYEQNMANFIKDVRKDLNVPKLPFVIAETGMGGFDEEEVRALALMNAQAAVAKRPEFKNTVAFVGTRAFWREAEVSPSDQGYHWNNNGETYYLIGDAMGQAMNELLKKGSK